MSSRSENPVDRRFSRFFGTLEQVFYIGVALALSLAGASLFFSVTWRFATSFGRGNLSTNVLEFLDGLLFVFIITELIHTVTTVIAENVLRAEPFLVVGIVAAIRRVIVIAAQAERQVGKPEFADLMFEMAVLLGAVLVLGTSIFLVRRSARVPEPGPG